jgi:hypothetical protein
VPQIGIFNSNDEPELISRGERRLKLRQTELAAQDFRDAIALAQRIRAKAAELRARTSLARLLAKLSLPTSER